MNYKPNYPAMLEKANQQPQDLPVKIQQLIEKFERARVAIEQANEGTAKGLLPALVGADAVIAAEIYRLYKPEIDKAERLRLLELEAEALELEWKLTA